MISEMEQIVLSSVPDKYKCYMKYVLALFKAYPNIIRWTKNRELVYMNKIIPGSDFTTLVLNVLPMFDNSDLPGYDQFLMCVSHVNLAGTHEFFNRYEALVYNRELPPC